MDGEKISVRISAKHPKEIKVGETQLCAIQIKQETERWPYEKARIKLRIHLMTLPHASYEEVNGCELFVERGKTESEGCFLLRGEQEGEAAVQFTLVNESGFPVHLGNFILTITP